MRSERKANWLWAKSETPGVYLRGRAEEEVILILRALRDTSKILISRNTRKLHSGIILENYSQKLYAEIILKVHRESCMTLGIYWTVVWAKVGR